MHNFVIFLFRLMNEKTSCSLNLPMSIKTNLLSFCFATSSTFQSFQIILNLIYIHINVHACIYTYIHIYIYKWVYVFAFLGMFQYIHDIIISLLISMIHYLIAMTIYDPHYSNGY